MALTKYTNKEMVDYPNCHALTESGKCVWLSLSACRGAGCPFMKTEEDNRNSLEHARARLASLDEATQAHIARKYYGGKRPWYKK